MLQLPGVRLQDLGLQQVGLVGGDLDESHGGLIWPSGPASFGRGFCFDCVMWEMLACVWFYSGSWEDEESFSLGELNRKKKSMHQCWNCACQTPIVLVAPAKGALFFLIS